MLREKELGDPGIGHVVEEDRTQEGLLDLGVVRRLRDLLNVRVAQRCCP
jgi:hypothetical protein